MQFTGMCRYRRRHLVLNRVFFLSDQSRLEDSRSYRNSHVVSRPVDIRDRPEAHPGTDGEGFVSAVPAIRRLPAPARGAEGQYQSAFLAAENVIDKARIILCDTAGCF